MARKKPDELYVGDNIEVILIGGEVKYYQITGVDNFVFSLFDRVGGIGNADVIIEKNEFARTVTGNITVI